MTTPHQISILDQVVDHLSRIYPDIDTAGLASRALEQMKVPADTVASPMYQNKWSERDAWMISYGDSVVEEGVPPLRTLDRFIQTYLSEAISGVHILPFFPYSSDDGFSVIDYSQVNDSLGGWEDIEAIAEHKDVMGDLVINHCSVRSRWFENFKQGKDPGRGYFVEASKEDDLSKVVRPRTSKLLKKVRTLDGKTRVWCTFGHDQVDLNFKNPDVFLEMVTIIRRYLEQGIRIFRLDAVAFLWKEVGTNCIHLPQTHEFVRLFRTLIEAHSPDAIVITETNVPNHENLSYFGNANEAHGVYNFALPPLLLHALITGTSTHLKRWQMSMPPARDGTFYFNFIASHDGVGLRPVTDLLQQQDIDTLVNTLQSFGARVSWREVAKGINEPYEINVSLFDALQGTTEGPDKWQLQRFICAHAIMFAMEGIPGVYVHSFLATNNDYEKLELTRHNRSINRHKWDYLELEHHLSKDDSHHAKSLSALTKLLKIRAEQTAFHPNAVQFTLHLGDQVFAFWRQSADRTQSIFCIHNVSDRTIEIPLSMVNLISTEDWVDLISGQQFDDINGGLTLTPYGCAWISNQGHRSAQ